MVWKHSRMSAIPGVKGVGLRDWPIMQLSLDARGSGTDADVTFQRRGSDGAFFLSVATTHGTVAEVTFRLETYLTFSLYHVHISA